MPRPGTPQVRTDSMRRVSPSATPRRVREITDCLRVHRQSRAGARDRRVMGRPRRRCRARSAWRSFALPRAVVASVADRRDRAHSDPESAHEEPRRHDERIPPRHRGAARDRGRARRRVPRGRARDHRRVHRRRRLLRDLGLPDHGAAGRRARAHRVDLVRLVLRPPRPAPAPDGGARADRRRRRHGVLHPARVPPRGALRRALRRLLLLELAVRARVGQLPHASAERRTRCCTTGR